MLTDEERAMANRTISYITRDFVPRCEDSLVCAKAALRLDAELAVLRAAGYAVTKMKESGKDERLVAYILEGSPAHGEEAKTDAIISENAHLHAQLAAMGKRVEAAEDENRRLKEARADAI